MTTLPAVSLPLDYWAVDGLWAYDNGWMYVLEPPVQPPGSGYGALVRVRVGP